jgi:hypothetical protein
MLDLYKVSYLLCFEQNNQSMLAGCGCGCGRGQNSRFGFGHGIHARAETHKYRYFILTFITRQVSERSSFLFFSKIF